VPNYQGKRRRSTAGAQGTNAGHEDGEAMARVGVRLTAQLGWWKYQGKRRRSTEGAKGTNTGHKMAKPWPVLASA